MSPARSWLVESRGLLPTCVVTLAVLLVPTAGCEPLAEAQPVATALVKFTDSEVRCTLLPTSPPSLWRIWAQTWVAPEDEANVVVDVFIEPRPQPGEPGWPEFPLVRVWDDEPDELGRIRWFDSRFEEHGEFWADVCLLLDPLVVTFVAMTEDGQRATTDEYSYERWF